MHVLRRLELRGQKKLQGRDFFLIKMCSVRVTGNKQLFLGLVKISIIESQGQKIQKLLSKVFLDSDGFF